MTLYYAYRDIYCSTNERLWPYQRSCDPQTDPTTPKAQAEPPARFARIKRKSQSVPVRFVPSLGFISFDLGVWSRDLRCP
eukprot:579311-Rhodomonas_salina.1